VTQEKLERILSKVAPERRESLRQMLLAPVWLPPLVSSFSMAALSTYEARAQGYNMS
jgi:hypothetical protein